MLDATFDRCGLSDGRDWMRAQGHSFFCDMPGTGGTQRSVRDGKKAE
jgi:hypothetical protein